MVKGIRDRDRRRTVRGEVEVTEDRIDVSGGTAARLRGACEDRVRAKAADDPVGAEAGRHAVVARAAVDGVVAAATVDGVVAAAAEDEIRAVAGHDDVIATGVGAAARRGVCRRVVAVEDIRPLRVGELVVAVSAIEDVVAGVAEQDVPLRRGVGDRGRDVREIAVEDVVVGRPAVVAGRERVGAEAADEEVVTRAAGEAVVAVAA